MGTSLKSTALEDTKPDYTQATEAAAALVVGAAELKVWFGSSLTDTGRIIEGLKQCADALREAGYPDPGAGDEVVALFTPDSGSPNVVITNQAALPSFAETEVAILIGAGYAGGAASQLFGGHVTHLIERIWEDNLKAA